MVTLGWCSCRSHRCFIRLGLGSLCGGAGCTLLLGYINRLLATALPIGCLPWHLCGLHQCLACVEWFPLKCQDTRFPTRTWSCEEMINVNHLTHQWFSCCCWDTCLLRYGSDPVLLRRPPNPTGCVLSLPWRSMVDSWRHETEEFPQ